MPSITKRLPTLFISHGGGPCFFMEWNPPGIWTGLERWLRGLGEEVGAKPKAIVVVSAHWEAEVFTAGANAQPPLIYDYSGFPAHTYQLTYPAPGSPPLAQRIVDLLSRQGLAAKTDSERGYDHGVFVPLKLMYPDAGIPVVQLSLKRGLDPATHLLAGLALAPLRDEGVLIVGSGYSYHNLRGYGGAGYQAADEFDGWLKQAMSASPAERIELLKQWDRAPSARAAHPREEHLLPLMIAAGAGADDAARCIFSEKVWGIQTSGFRFG